MKNNHQNTNPPINHSVEIANLYHQQVLGLINVALSHNKSSIEAAHRRAAELLRVKNAKEVQEFVAQHIVSHMNESLSYAVDAYRLGLEANMQLSKVFAMQIQDGLGLAQDRFNHIHCWSILFPIWRFISSRIHWTKVSLH